MKALKSTSRGQGRLGVQPSSRLKDRFLLLGNCILHCSNKLHPCNDAKPAFPPSMVVKQWRKPGRRIRELIKLGVRTHDAISLGLSRKSYW